jgi:hypothetical protein
MLRSATGREERAERTLWYVTTHRSERCRIAGCIALQATLFWGTIMDNLWIVLFALGVGPTACAPPPVARVDREPADALSLARALDRCENMHADTWPPVECHTAYSEHGLAMIVQVASEHHVREQRDAMVRDIAEPYCEAADRSGRRAGILMLVQGGRSRRWDCEQARWSEWKVPVFPTDENERNELGPFVMDLLRGLVYALQLLKIAAR